VVADWDDVRTLALSLPETSERLSRGHRRWAVRGKHFVWEPPLRQSDLKALGDAAPEGAILGASVEHLGAKDALLADPSGAFFTTPHFDGYPAILVKLDTITEEDLREVVVEAWLCRAPKRLVEAGVPSITWPGGASRHSRSRRWAHRSSARSSATGSSSTGAAASPRRRP